MICGVGGVIKIPESIAYGWYINCWEGTNTKVELMGVWDTLTLANLCNIQNLQILGDSKVVIDWLNHKGELQAIDIEGWKHRTMELTTLFQGICFHHIIRQFNKEVDRLSKQALLEPKGRLTYFTWEIGTTSPQNHVKSF